MSNDSTFRAPHPPEEAGAAEAFKVPGAQEPSEEAVSFEKKVQNALTSYQMIGENETVAVALSGGADSTALLLALFRLSESGTRFSVCACHLNHGIRMNADRDEAFARALAHRLGIRFYAEKTDARAICAAFPGESLETAARNVRYAFFRRASSALSAAKVATAHTASDNAETVLFHLARGAGAAGLSGIPPVRDLFIRPLTFVTRSEVEAYLSALHARYVTDETNADETVTRNFLRILVVPKLKEVNRSFEYNVRRTSELMRRDEAYFADEVKKLREKEPLAARALAALPPSILCRYLRTVFQEASKTDTALASVQIDAAADALCRTASDGKVRRIRLSFALEAVVTPSGILTAPPETAAAAAEKSNSDAEPERRPHIPLSFGKNIINDVYAVYLAAGGNFAGATAEKPPDILKNENIIYKLYNKVECFSAIMYHKVFVRARLPGDTLRLGGMSRKLKKVFSERHVPETERPKVPVVCDDEGVLCIPFFSAPRDSARPDGKDSVVFAFYRADAAE